MRVSALAPPPIIRVFRGGPHPATGPWELWAPLAAPTAAPTEASPGTDGGHICRGGGSTGRGPGQFLQRLRTRDERRVSPEFQRRRELAGHRGSAKYCTDWSAEPLPAAAFRRRVDHDRPAESGHAVCVVRLQRLSQPRWRTIVATALDFRRQRSGVCLRPGAFAAERPLRG